MNCLAFLSRAFSASRPLSCKSIDPEYPDSDNCVLRVIRDSDKWDMSPLWGFRCLVHVACYKHVAPLGLNTAASPSFFSSALRLCRFASLR